MGKTVVVLVHKSASNSICTHRIWRPPLLNCCVLCMCEESIHNLSISTMFNIWCFIQLHTTPHVQPLDRWKAAYYAIRILYANTAESPSSQYRSALLCRAQFKIQIFIVSHWMLNCSRRSSRRRNVYSQNAKQFSTSIFIFGCHFVISYNLPWNFGVCMPPSPPSLLLSLADFNVDVIMQFTT